MIFHLPLDSDERIKRKNGRSCTNRYKGEQNLFIDMFIEIMQNLLQFF